METKCLLFLMMMLFASASGTEDSDNAQTDEFHTETTKNGKVDEVTILDRNNKVVSVVEIFEDEGFQIDKPAEDDAPCYFRKIDQQGDQTNSLERDTCYVVDKEVSEEERNGLDVNTTRAFDNCRSVHVLEPEECDVIDKKATGGRKKRDWPVGNYCCHYKRYATTTCIRNVTTGCCKRFLGICIKRCKKCVSYSTQYVTRKLCHYG